MFMYIFSNTLRFLIIILFPNLMLSNVGTAVVFVVVIVVDIFFVGDVYFYVLSRCICCLF